MHGANLAMDLLLWTISQGPPEIADLCLTWGEVTAELPQTLMPYNIH